MERFCENGLQLKAVNYVSKKLHCRCLSGLQLPLWNFRDPGNLRNVSGGIEREQWHEIG